MSVDVRRELGEKKRLAEVLKEFKFAMLATRTTHGELRARPVTVSQIDTTTNDLWFATKLDSAKVDDVKHDRHVSLGFQDGASHFVSVSGPAEIITDRDIVTKLWQDTWDIWFPNGKFDMSNCLIRVTAEHGEFWDMTGTTGLGGMFSFITGGPTEKHGPLTLPEDEPTPDSDGHIRYPKSVVLSVPHSGGEKSPVEPPTPPLSHVDQEIQRLKEEKRRSLAEDRLAGHKSGVAYTINVGEKPDTHTGSVFATEAAKEAKKMDEADSDWMSTSDLEDAAHEMRHRMREQNKSYSYSESSDAGDAEEVKAKLRVRRTKEQLAQAAHNDIASRDAKSAGAKIKEGFADIGNAIKHKAKAIKHKFRKNKADALHDMVEYNEVQREIVNRDAERAKAEAARTEPVIVHTNDGRAVDAAQVINREAQKTAEKAQEKLDDETRGIRREVERAADEGRVRRHTHDAVDDLKDGARHAKHKVSDAAEDAGDAMRDAAKGAKHKAEDAAEDARHGARKVKHKAQELGEDIQHGAHKAKHRAEEGLDAMKDAAKDVKDTNIKVEVDHPHHHRHHRHHTHAA